MKPHGMQLGITTVKDHFANLVCQIPACIVILPSNENCHSLREDIAAISGNRFSSAFKAGRWWMIGAFEGNEEGVDTNETGAEC
ncbi:hypothetical protein N7536_007670 [Penicillium majusculum]|nr:hypothetical protein N7536_007670 [Penicillium majusculum]